MAKERPIPFSGEMVRAILEGRKTQTRRIISPQPEHLDGGYFWPSRKDWQVGWAAEDSGAAKLPGFKVEPATEWFLQNDKCKYGQPGDRLWVREPWKVRAGFNNQKPSELSQEAEIWYLSDGPWAAEGIEGRYRHARFMPRWASRILLEITDIRVERLQDISEEDAKAEGIQLPGNQCDYIGVYQQYFKQLWESINGPGSWEANPWVWVVGFRRIT